MALSYNPTKSLELHFEIGGDAVATCYVRAVDNERDVERGDPTVASPGHPGVRHLTPPLPDTLGIDVEVQGRADTDFLLVTELRQERRLPRFETAYGRVARGALANLSFVAMATRGADALGPAELLEHRLVRPPRYPSPAAEPEPAPPSDEEGADYIVWFGTNRKPIVWQGAVIDFAFERDANLHLGQCRVTIPRSHEIGSVGSSWLKRILRRTDDRLTVAAIHVLAQETYWAEIERCLSDAPTDERHGVVFIHGFNTTFKSAAIRAAQLGFDLKIGGAMAFYSWPSQGRIGGYMADEASIEASEGFIADYLGACPSNRL